MGCIKCLIVLVRLLMITVFLIFVDKFVVTSGLGRLLHFMETRKHQHKTSGMTKNSKSCSKLSLTRRKATNAKYSQARNVIDERDDRRCYTSKFYGQMAERMYRYGTVLYCTYGYDLPNPRKCRETVTWFGVSQGGSVCTQYSRGTVQYV